MSRQEASVSRTSTGPTAKTRRLHPLASKFTFLTVEYHDRLPHVTTIVLNRPKKRNAINFQMWKEIGEAFHEVGSMGDGCRCVLLKGSGKGFCGGISPSEFNDNDDNSSRDAARKSLAFRSQILQMQDAFTALEECPVPVVVAIHGACIGAGVDLACCADIRLCSKNAVFGVREVRLGLAADVGTLQRFPKIVGFSSRVRELCLTGDDFGAEDACKIGFVSRVSENEEYLQKNADEVCSKITRHSPVAVSVTKISLNYSRDHSVHEGLKHIALQNSSALMSEDLMKSFLMSSGATDIQFDAMRAHSRL
ncbi:hypothetical protein ACHAXS_005496 [Conticribra weissflogii]